MNLDFYDYFYPAFFGDNKYSVITSRRREGKTYHAVIWLGIQALQNANSKSLWVDTNQGNLDKYYDRYWYPIFHEIFKRELASYSRQSKILKFKNGSVIDFSSAERPENMEGFGYDFIVCNEAGIIFKKAALWDNSLSPMAKNAKKVILIGCVVGETKILTQNGVEKIAESCSNSSPQQLVDINKVVYGIDGKWVTADGFWNNGVVPTKIITTSKGFQIECSHNHPLLSVEKKWKKCGELNLGDKLAIDRGMEVWGSYDPLHGYNSIPQIRGRAVRTHSFFVPKLMDCDFAYLLGLWLAEGSYGKKASRLTLTCGDDVTKNVVRYGFHRCRKDQWRMNSKEMCMLFEHIGMPLTIARNKSLPEFIWRSPRDIVSDFLSGYFDGDGHTRGDRKTLGFTTSSLKLIKELQILCTNFGAIGKIYEKFTPPTIKVKKWCTGYQLIFEGSDYDRIVDFIKPRIPRKKQKIEDLKTKLKRYSSYYKEADGYFYDSIIKIEDSEAQTYDFTIPETHSFWSNGFISHNTPKGKNKFFDLAQNELANKDWKTFRVIPEVSKQWTKEELEIEKLTKSDAVYRQEICGEFITEGADVFRIETSTPELSLQSTHVLGIDLGEYDDETVVIGRDSMFRTTHIEAWADTSFEIQKPRILALWAKMGYPKVNLDATGMGISVFDSLRVEMGTALEGISFTNKIKNDLVENARVLIETKKHVLFNNPHLISQMTAYEHSTTKLGGSTYNAPDGMHDDYVISLLLALWEFRSNKVSVSNFFVG